LEPLEKAGIRRGNNGGILPQLGEIKKELSQQKGFRKSNLQELTRRYITDWRKPFQERWVLGRCSLEVWDPSATTYALASLLCLAISVEMLLNPILC
jgi:hypothetical protein